MTLDELLITYGIFALVSLDSKVLNEAQRDTLFASIKSSDFIGWRVAVISPNHISNGMLQRCSNY